MTPRSATQIWNAVGCGSLGISKKEQIRTPISQVNELKENISNFKTPSLSIEVQPWQLIKAKNGTEFFSVDKKGRLDTSVARSTARKVKSVVCASPTNYTTVECDKKEDTYKACSINCNGWEI